MFIFFYLISFIAFVIALSICILVFICFNLMKDYDKIFKSETIAENFCLFDGICLQNFHSSLFLIFNIRYTVWSAFTCQSGCVAG